MGFGSQGANLIADAIVHLPVHGGKWFFADVPGKVGELAGAVFVICLHAPQMGREAVEIVIIGADRSASIVADVIDKGIEGGIDASEG